jgi:hypothetical protein
MTSEFNESFLKEIIRYTKLVPVEDGFRKAFIIDDVAFMVSVSVDRLWSKFVKFDNASDANMVKLFEAVNANRDVLMEIFKSESILFEIDEELYVHHKPTDWLVTMPFFTFGKFRVSVILECDVVSEDNQRLKYTLGAVDVYANTKDNPTYQNIVALVETQPYIVQFFTQLPNKTQEDYAISDFYTQKDEFFRLTDKLLSTTHSSGDFYLRLYARTYSRPEILET